MEKLNKKEVAGVIMMLVSLVFFSVFIYWGTTSYKPDFAIGIVLVASGIFLSGIVTFNSSDKSKDKA